MDITQLPSTFIETQFAAITTFNIRFSHHVMKIEENLYAFINVMEEPKEDIDSSTIQREKRIRIEFSRRFTRDYLYPIQLKIKELENEYLAFFFKENCKVAQSMILRPLVLTVMKKLSSSTQTYLQFLRNNKSKIFIKLREILNLITHSFEIIKSIVDHQILENANIQELCRNIANINDNYCLAVKQKSSTIKGGIEMKNIRKNNIMKPTSKYNQLIEQENQRKNETDENEIIICDHQRLKNASFSHTVYSPRIKETAGDSKDGQTNVSFALHSSVSEFCAGISDHILNELLIELVCDMNETIKKLALNVFELEFSYGA